MTLFVDPTQAVDIWDTLAKSPVLVAVVSVLLVKVVDVINERWKFIGTDKKDMRGELWREIATLKKEVNAQNTKNDMLVLDKAKLEARVGLLEAQNALQFQQVLAAQKERDDFQRKFEETNEALHRTMLELREAQVRIKQLEEYTVSLKRRQELP